MCPAQGNKRISNPRPLIPESDISENTNRPTCSLTLMDNKYCVLHGFVFVTTQPNLSGKPDGLTIMTYLAWSELRSLIWI